jgi:hypothetical protein
MARSGATTHTSFGLPGPRGRGRHRPLVLSAVLALAAQIPALLADVIVLKDGKTIEGEVKERESTYDIVTKYGLVTVRKEEVNKVVRISALTAEADILRRAAVAMLQETQKPETPPEDRQAKLAAAEETMKRSLALYQEARAVSPVDAAANLDKAIAGIKQEIALCREQKGSAAGASVVPPKPVELAPPKPPAAGPPKPDRPPEPDARAKTTAEVLIRDIYKVDYARRSPADQQALAAKLIQQAAETKDDPAAQFVLLREARDLAAQAGDPATALDAVDKLAAGFAVDALAMKSAALAAASRAPRAPAALIAKSYLNLIDEAVDADQYDAAIDLATKAETAARLAKDAPLAGEAQSRRKDIESMRKEYQAVKDAWKTLKEKSDDPAANLNAGRFLCLVKGDWEKGLRLLARGSDPALQALAVKELAEPAKADERVALGDGWWDAAADKHGTAKSRLQARALHWYEKALPDTTGLVKAKLNQRIELLYRSMSGEGTPCAGIVFWVEPGRSPANPLRDLASGSHATNHGVKVEVSGGVRVLSFALRTYLDYEVPPPVQNVEKNGSVFAWIKYDKLAGWGGIFCRGVKEKGVDVLDFSFCVSPNRMGAFFNWPATHSWAGFSKSAVPAGKWALCGYTWDDKRILFYMDGKEDGTVVLPAGTPQKHAARVLIGADLPGSPEYYSGLMGSVMVFNRTLTAPEVLWLSTVGRGKFK